MISRIQELFKTHPVVVFATVAIRIFIEQRVTGLAQQVAYNLLFSVAPMLIFLTALGGLVVQRTNAEMANPVQPVLDWMDGTLPEDAADFLEGPIEAALSTDPAVLISFGGVLALWGAKNAIASIMVGLNLIYGIKQVQPFFSTNLVAIGLTIGLAVSIVVSAALELFTTSLGDELTEEFSLGSGLTHTIVRLQWPVTVTLVLLGVIVLHRFGPRFSAPFLWYLPGAVATLLGFTVATWALQIYFQVFDTYDAYGVFGAVLVFIFWLFIVALVILIGGIVNATLFEVYPPAIRALADFRLAEQERAKNTPTLKQRARTKWRQRDRVGERAPTDAS